MAPTRIIDAHHHVWRVASTPWLSGAPQPRIFGDYESIRRDYTIDEYLDDIEGNGVVGSVYVQVNVEPDAEIEEVSFVAGESRRRGMMQAIVSFVDLASPRVGHILDEQIEAGPVRGVRQQLHWHPDPAYRFASAPDLMNDSAWQAGLHEVFRRGLHFELQVFVAQIPDTIRLVDRFPEARFLLLHAGMLHDTSPTGWAAWTDQMAALARRPNVSVKLSGLGTFDRSCSVEQWRPVVERTIELFGPERCIFGSNFPIEKLWTSYGNLIDVMRRCLDRQSATDIDAVLYRNAAEYYFIDPHTPNDERQPHAIPGDQ